MTRAAVLFSGGKDSVYAAYISQQRQQFETISTLTLLPSAQDSYMFHVPNALLAGTISSAMGMRNSTYEMRDGEDELEALSKAVESTGAGAVVTGAVASDYQAQRINMVCEPLGVRVFSPFWQMDHEMLLREMVGAGFKILMVGAAADGIDERWVGREIDSKAIDELIAISDKRKINIGGEGGEFETCVLDGPNFKKRLEIASSTVCWKKDSGHMRIHALRAFDKIQ